MQVTNTAPRPEPPSPLREAAQQFDALFVQQLLAAMRRTSPSGGALTASRGETQFRDLLDGELAQKIAARGGIGIADVICQQLEPTKGDKLDAHR